MQLKDQMPLYGFTLIELSIVLVIIGLIVGGVLAGQSLVRAAAIRATITQIEKFNTAANTFRGKYGYLPGDIPDPAASSFGFKARGLYAGEGDGNGIIEGVDSNAAGQNAGMDISGESSQFWEDLAAAQLIEGSFSIANPAASPPTLTSISSPGFKDYFPLAKLGRSNYIYVWSGGFGASARFGAANGINYFGISALTIVNGAGAVASNPALSVAEAYGIDRKIDDGYPRLGKVTTVFINQGDVQQAISGYWAVPTGSSTSCFDDHTGNVSVGNGGFQQSYSMQISDGSNVNCAISIQFQ